MHIAIYLALVSLVIENLTELGVKSVILSRPRNYLISISEFFSGLLTCGYCFSFWVSLVVNWSVLVFASNEQFNLLGLGPIGSFLVIVIATHRGSNMVHGAIDRYFDTRKDVRYNKGN